MVLVRRESGAVGSLYTLINTVNDRSTVKQPPTANRQPPTAKHTVVDSRLQRLDDRIDNVLLKALPLPRKTDFGD